MTSTEHPLPPDCSENVWGEQLAEVLDPNATAALSVIPRQRPSIRFSDDDPVFHLELEQLALEMVTELDHRQLRIFEAGVSGDIGLSIDVNRGTLLRPCVWGSKSRLPR